MQKVVPMINAAILRRSVAETITTLNIPTVINSTSLSNAGEQSELTTASTPILADAKVTTFNNTTPSTIVEKVDLTTQKTPLLADAPTAVKPTLKENSTSLSDAGGQSDLTTASTPILADVKVTTFNNTTPSIIVEKVDLTTQKTPLLADAQTAVKPTLNENIHNNAEVSILNDTKTKTTVKSNLHNALTSNTPQDVDNEINNHHVVAAENIATEIRIEPDFTKPKFDYTDTLLDGNLEETIRNSVKNEIEFEHDIGAAVIEQLQEVTDPEERQKLSDEILAIQSAQQQSSVKANISEAVDVLTVESSNEPETVSHQQSSKTESATTTAKDLSIYFPTKIEERPSTVNNQRNARNLNEESSENLEVLNESKNGVSNFAENENMQNIEEEKEKNPNELINEGDNPAPTSSSDVSDATIYSHEANEITENDLAASTQREINEPVNNIDQEEHVIVNAEAEQKEEKELVDSGSVGATDDNELLAKQTQDNELSIVLEENLNSTQEKNENEQKPDVGQEDMSVQLTGTEEKSAEGDEDSLSIVLDENLTATESVPAVANEQLEHLLNLNVSEPLLIEDVDTTLEPEIVKTVHIVIKKQGVELDDDATTTNVGLEKKNALEEESDINETTVTIIADGESENYKNVNTAQNDDAANEETTTETTESHVSGSDIQKVVDSNNELTNNVNDISIKNDEQNDLEEHTIFDTTDPTRNELDAKFELDEQAVHNEYQHDPEAHDKYDSHINESTNTDRIQSVSDQETTADTIPQEEREDFSTTEETISLSHTTQIPGIGTTQARASNSDSQTTTLKEFEVYEDNTDDPDIVPILVGVSGGQSDLTASTKGSRSINTQTHHSMFLTQMDDTMAATLFETFAPQNSGQMFNDHLAAESSGGRIGKPLPTSVGISEASTSASLFSGSGLIIVLCASIAFIFLLASVVAFVISFQHQRGTLDIEMQEQRCGKDNLDEEDEIEVGACTKLLDIELPKSTIVVSSEELEECL
ncbi:enolase-phosphatase E1 isoform X2 [Eurosta solidaginis]|uniref:enolase-phosphatase E1 isoform X2 n=1 Tax=Eurosta solidaginis TaxID=178769 RepID=UPI003530D1F1